jgi:transketolase-like protein
LSDGRWRRVETGIGDMATAVLELLPAPRAAALCQTVTIDLDTTDVEVYGRRKRGVAYNHQGQRVGRPHVASWAETATVLAADLMPGTDAPRPHAAELLRRALAARFAGYGCAVQHVADANDLAALLGAFDPFQAEVVRPTLIVVDSVIGYGAAPAGHTHAANCGPTTRPAAARFLFCNEARRVLARHRLGGGACRLLAHPSGPLSCTVRPLTPFVRRR